jgi:hypothetical protein
MPKEKKKKKGERKTERKQAEAKTSPVAVSEV